MRLTNSEHMRLTVLAKKADLSFSRFLVQSGLTGQAPTNEDRIQRERAILQLARVGNNVNQIARQLNSQRGALSSREIEKSLEFLEALLASLPAGDCRSACGPLAKRSLGVALVEGWRGEIMHVLRTDDAGRIAHYKVKDPSFHNWTALAVALRDQAISDFPLINKSFNLSYAGHDL